MKYRFPLVLILLPQLTIASLAQQPVRQPAQTQSSAGQRSAPPPPPQDDEVVRITTKLVQVDAVVTDGKGKLVTDLKPEELQISEDGKPQTITNFSYYVAAPDPAAPVATRTTTSDKNAPPVPPTRLRPDQVRRTMALVVDDLGLSFQSVYYVRRALKKFVDEQMQPGDLVAIVRTAGGMGALQQFTSDKRLLYAAIERVKWGFGRSGISAFAPIEASLIPADDEERRAPEDVDQLREDLFAVGTLGALNYVVRGLRELPGRKSILLLSDGIKIFNQDDPTRTDRVLQNMKRLVDLANRSSVVIYTMDARGLQTLSLQASDNVAGMSPEQVQRQLSNRNSDLLDSQYGLSFLAEQTGGIAIRNNNDLNSGVKRVLEDQKGYYLIGYRPDDSTFDVRGRRKFHKLSLKVLRPGKFNVRMRTGFYGISEDEERPAPKTAPQQMISALTSPFGSSGVHLRMTSLFANDPKVGSIMRSLLHVDGRDLTFTEQPDGWHQTVFSIMAVTFGDNGGVVDQVGYTHTMRVKGPTYQRILKQGFVYFVTVPIKKPGAYQMRTALRDQASSRVGSVSQFVEVPDFKKNRLTLSGVLVTAEDPEAKSRPAKTAAPTANAGQEIPDTDPAAIAAVRQFQRGQSMGYGYFIYNPQLNKATGRPQLVTQARLFRDGKLVFTGKEIPFDAAGQTDLKRLTAGAALRLGTEMAPGEYTFQVVVTDLLAKEKYRTATQWIDFEIMK
ncbi:MAG: VWA domain-containing protein [Pyrinomonadaceae bacterium]